MRCPTYRSLARYKKLGMPGPCSWTLPKYPYLIVYFRHPDAVDVVDLPHTRTNYIAALSNQLSSP